MMLSFWMFFFSFLKQAAHVRITDKFVCLCHLVFFFLRASAACISCFDFLCLSCKLCLSVLVLCLSVQVLDVRLYCLLLMYLWLSLFFCFFQPSTLVFSAQCIAYSYERALLCLCHMCLHGQVCGFNKTVVCGLCLI